MSRRAGRAPSFLRPPAVKPRPNHATYKYDGDGRRVNKADVRLYWYGVGGEVLFEMQGSENYRYIFFGGQRIARAFSRLPAKLRVAATLALIEERPYQEIAEALGISVGGVKSRVFRGVRWLRKELKAQGVEP